jgi:hypothetical protein
MLNKIKQCEYDYAAYLPCGCLVGLCVDMADKETGKNVSKWITEGCAVKRVHRSELKEIMANGIGCKCEQKQTEGQISLF